MARSNGYGKMGIQRKALSVMIGTSYSIQTTRTKTERESQGAYEQRIATAHVGVFYLLVLRQSVVSLLFVTHVKLAADLSKSSDESR